jgi:hypothetical protein
VKLQILWITQKKSIISGFSEKSSASHPGPEIRVHVLVRKSNPCPHRMQQAKTSMRAAHSTMNENLTLAVLKNFS